jgi:hypothetical protein
MGEKEPEVITLVEGDEETIADFKKLVETRKPEHSNVLNIALDMRNDLKAVRKTSDMTLDEIKGMSEDIQPGVECEGY